MCTSRWRAALLHRKVIKTDEAKLLSELAQFTGTTAYHRSSLGGLLLTDGAHHLRERANCYWLIDVIESYGETLGTLHPDTIGSVRLG